MIPILLAMPGNEQFALHLDRALGCEVGRMEVHRFPDGESCVRILSPVHGRDVILVCTLDRPDERIMPLYFAACTARELGARRVGLVAPYLSYMRQDARFREGEGVTAAHFARFVSDFCDWMITVDPHLHRYRRLAEIYSIPTRAVGAAADIAAWIEEHVERPLIVGPDAESEQWVGAVAERLGCRHAVLEKTRTGDREVSVTALCDVEAGCTPVLVDDIASSAQTMIAAVARIREAGMAAPVCIAIHPVFAGGAYDDLLAAGAARIVSCNTIPHPSNGIDIADAIGLAVGELLAEPLIEP
ncbi:ribose-phosphate pyrophosphokinase [Noviherbaspirillum aridicola]|uniref:ribose-phosphate diphosphokinase n=1 Tax=Noviherbaspirillum aridicola TaxID=2849687 RepID=A0ABQ4Q321_9BURK|nr:ribose-phosphate pyrophosphokinase [Noviherbaspirillum aridicola]GIZ51586.1 phosphoribosylpyrophosphate synthetase [Noviherbaspirillum aridicola]